MLGFPVAYDVGCWKDKFNCCMLARRCLCTDRCARVCLCACLHARAFPHSLVRAYHVASITRKLMACPYVDHSTSMCVWIKDPASSWICYGKRAKIKLSLTPLLFESFLDLFGECFLPINTLTLSYSQSCSYSLPLMMVLSFYPFSSIVLIFDYRMK